MCTRAANVQAPALCHLTLNYTTLRWGSSFKGRSSSHPAHALTSTCWACAQHSPSGSGLGRRLTPCSRTHLNMLRMRVALPCRVRPGGSAARCAARRQGTNAHHHHRAVCRGHAARCAHPLRGAPALLALCLRRTQHPGWAGTGGCCARSPGSDRTRPGCDPANWDYHSARRRARPSRPAARQG